MTQRCEIIAEPQKDGPLWRSWKFVAVDQQGERIAESEPVRSGIRGLLHGEPEHRVLEGLLYRLRLDGWQLEPRGNQWYQLRLYRTQSAPASNLRPAMVAQREPPQDRRGMSTQAMWGISLVVIVGLVLCLFLVCVVLVYSTEFRVRPQ